MTRLLGFTEGRQATVTLAKLKPFFSLLFLFGSALMGFQVTVVRDGKEMELRLTVGSMNAISKL